MAPPGRRDPRSVAQRLRDEPQAFEFFQAVRLLELLHARAVSVGDGVRPADEAVRFRTSLKSAFPASAIDTLSAPAGGQAEMVVNFMGLTGVAGPLPAPFAELAMRRARAGHGATRDLLDIFNHRLLSVRYRAARKHRPPLNRGAPSDSPFALYLYAVMGLAGDALRHRLEAEDRALLAHAGALARVPHSLHALEQLVSAHLGLAVRARPAQGRFLAIAADEVTVLGRANHRLGSQAVLGARVWDQQAGLRLETGPLDLPQYLALLPHGSMHRPTRSLARFVVGDTRDVDLGLTLKAAQVPASRLHSAGGPCLGWNAWLTTRPRPDDAVVTLPLLPARILAARAVLRLRVSRHGDTRTRTVTVTADAEAFPETGLATAVAQAMNSGALHGLTLVHWGRCYLHEIDAAVAAPALAAVVALLRDAVVAETTFTLVVQVPVRVGRAMVEHAGWRLRDRPAPATLVRRSRLGAAP